MAPVWQAPWSMYMVALVGQGAHAAAFMLVHNGSLTGARIQADHCEHFLADTAFYDADTYCIKEADFPQYVAGPTHCTLTCKFLDGLPSAEACHDAVRYTGCSTTFTWRADDGRCWGKSSGYTLNSWGGYTSGNIGLSDCQTSTTTTAAPTSATGDPHLQNIRGERFDVMKEGNHVLINIPRGMSAENALLRVLADARRLGGQCADMYFQQVNITGSWAYAKHVGGYRYSASQASAETPQSVAFGKVGLKVVHGRTESGVLYLNLYAKHLGRTGFDVGGLLGDDDHGDAVVAPSACAKEISLHRKAKITETSGQASRSASPVEIVATFE